MDGVDRPIREVLEGVRRRIAPLSEGIHLETVLERRFRSVRLTVLIQEPSQNQPVDFAWSRRNEVAISICRGRMAWTKNQILAAFAFVWTGATHVDNKAEKGVINGARPRARGHLNHHRAVTEVQKG